MAGEDQMGLALGGKLIVKARFAGDEDVAPEFCRRAYEIGCRPASDAYRLASGVRVADILDVTRAKRLLNFLSQFKDGEG